MKAPTWAACLEQAWTRTPHLQTCDSSKLSHVSVHTTAIFGFGDAGGAPKGFTQNSQSSLSATYF